MVVVQVAAGLNFTVFLTREGHVYTCGTNTHGQLGHGDNLDRPTPTNIELLKGVGSVAQVAAGPGYVLAVTDNGAVYSFGSGSNFCLGHGEQHDELQPRVIQTFRRKNIHVVRVSAGDEHAVALGSNGYVSLDPNMICFLFSYVFIFHVIGICIVDVGIHLGQGLLRSFGPW